MAFVKKTKGFKPKKATGQPANRSNAVQQPNNSLNDEFPEVPLFPQTRENQAGTSFNKKRRFSGEVKTKGGINWSNHDRHIELRAREILDGIKKQPSSGKMLENQLEFTTKLAQLEEIRDEIQLAQVEVGMAFLSSIHKPADWVRDPTRQPHWSTRSAKNIHINEAVSVGSDEYEEFKRTEHLARLPKLADCIKQMNIEVHPKFLKAWYMESLPAEAAAVGVRIIQDPAMLHRTVAITRTMPRELEADKQTLRLSSPRQHTLRYVHVGRGAAARLPALAARANRLPGQHTLALLDDTDCFQAKTTDLDVAITDLLVSLEIDTVIVRSAEELVTLIMQFTKALAEEPIKLAKRAVDEEADFYMRGDNKNCVSVDQQGNGLSRLWQQMLGVLPQSSLEVSRAIAAQYKSPSSLAEELSGPGGAGRVSALGVTRSAAPAAVPRRLGLEMASKLHKLFTEDGHVII